MKEKIIEYWKSFFYLLYLLEIDYSLGLLTPFILTPQTYYCHSNLASQIDQSALLIKDTSKVNDVLSSKTIFNLIIKY